MKTHKISSFLAGMITMALLIGLCGTAFAAARTEQQTLHFNNIKIKLNGETVTPKNEGGGVVEPFIINGTTYLPVRAVSNMLGCTVGWDANTHTVSLESNTTDFGYVQLLGYCEILRESFSQMQTAFGTMATKVSIQEYMSLPSNDGTNYYAAVERQTKSKLETIAGHYNVCHDILTEEEKNLYTEYVRLANILIDWSGTLQSFPSSATLDYIVGASRQNYADCTLHALTASSCFWQIYQEA